MKYSPRNIIIFFIGWVLFRQFVKFCLVGFTNLLIDFLVYWLLTRALGLFYIIAAILSFLVAVTWSFFINRHWTFRHFTGNIRRQYVKFFLANLASLVLNLAIFYALVDWGGLNDLLAKLLVAVIVAFFNFGLNRFWTFNQA
ncbi:MAG TPA: GtrA family protein [bacterium]|nr:GtrA family protein [bacterium]